MTPAPRPPHSSGQAIAAYRASASVRFHQRRRSRRSPARSIDQPPPAPFPRRSSGRLASSHARNSARNASASPGYRKSITHLPNCWWIERVQVALRAPTVGSFLEAAAGELGVELPLPGDVLGVQLVGRADAAV